MSGFVLEEEDRQTTGGVGPHPAGEETHAESGVDAPHVRPHRADLELDRDRTATIAKPSIPARPRPLPSMRMTPTTPDEILRAVLGASTVDFTLVVDACRSGRSAPARGRRNRCARCAGCWWDRVVLNWVPTTIQPSTLSGGGSARGGGGGAVSLPWPDGRDRDDRDVLGLALEAVDGDLAGREAVLHANEVNARAHARDERAADGDERTAVDRDIASRAA